MRILSVLLVSGLIAAGLLVACAPAYTPTPRELMRERIMDRRAAFLARNAAPMEDTTPIVATGNAPYAPMESTGVGVDTSEILTASTGAAGVRRVEMNIGGQTRYFLVHVPARVSDSPGVVIAFHGGGGDATRFMNRNTLVSYADRGRFVAVFPDGNRLWNDGRLRTAGGADDVRFVRAIVDWAVTNLNADRSRVFATGISNGGMMAMRLACDAPGLVRAIAPIAANFTDSTYSSCRPQRPTPVIMFSGTSDPLMLFNGGRPNMSALQGGSRQPLENVVSTEKSIQLWARLARCGTPTETNLPDRANDGTTVTRIVFACPREEVVLYRVNGGGHTWPGASTASDRMARLVGATTQDISATELMLDFFRKYGL